MKSTQNRGNYKYHFNSFHVFFGKLTQSIHSNLLILEDLPPCMVPAPGRLRPSSKAQRSFLVQAIWAHHSCSESKLKHHILQQNTSVLNSFRCSYCNPCFLNSFQKRLSRRSLPAFPLSQLHTLRAQCIIWSSWLRDDQSFRQWRSSLSQKDRVGLEKKEK